MAQGAAPEVVGLGQCCWDILGRLDQWPEQDQKAEFFDPLEQGGGPVATALVTLARLGVRTAVMGRTGDDDYGRRIRAGLAEEGVDVSRLLNDPGRTSQFAFIAVDRRSASRTIFWHRGSARALRPDELDLCLVRSARVLHLDGLHPEAAAVAAMEARRAGIAVVLDGGTYRKGMEPLLAQVDHLVVSERFAGGFCPDLPPEGALERLRVFGGRAVTVTCGIRGSFTLTAGGETFHTPAFAVDAVDTTGCGDVFHGGYIFGLLQGWPMNSTLRFAAACAALKTRAIGGRTAIPRLREAQDFLATASWAHPPVSP